MKPLLIFLLIFFSRSLFGQDFSSLKNLNFNSENDYKIYESQVLTCANYVLHVPLSNDSNRFWALQTVIKWMRGTPDFTFELDNNIIAISKKNEEILGVFMAAMTQYVLENREKADNEKAVTLNSYIIFLNYCEDPANKVTITKRIQKAIDAKNDNRLERYLQL